MKDLEQIDNDNVSKHVTSITSDQPQAKALIKE